MLRCAILLRFLFQLLNLFLSIFIFDPFFSELSYCRGRLGLCSTASIRHIPSLHLLNISQEPSQGGLNWHSTISLRLNILQLVLHLLKLCHHPRETSLSTHRPSHGSKSIQWILPTCLVRLHTSKEYFFKHLDRVEYVLSEIFYPKRYRKHDEEVLS